MKRARRYAARAVFVVVWFAFLPFAFAHVVLEAIMLGVYSMLDGLEGIIHDDPEQPETAE
jgi:hypothetical protein